MPNSAGLTPPRSRPPSRYDIIKTISVAVKAFKYTACISLLQPPPEVVGLFDEMLLLREGHLIYQGSVNDAAVYMSRLGYPCPPAMDAADFLIQVRKIYIDDIPSSVSL